MLNACSLLEATPLIAKSGTAREEKVDLAKFLFCFWTIKTNFVPSLNFQTLRLQSLDWIQGPVKSPGDFPLTSLCFGPDSWKGYSHELKYLKPNMALHNWKITYFVCFQRQIHFLAVTIKNWVERGWKQIWSGSSKRLWQYSCFFTAALKMRIFNADFLKLEHFVCLFYTFE